MEKNIYFEMKKKNNKYINKHVIYFKNEKNEFRMNVLNIFETK